MKKRKELTAAQRKKAGLPQKLSLAAQSIGKDTWYYEEPRSIHLITWAEAPRAMSKGERDHVHVRIPWKKLEATMKRYRAYRRAKGSAS